MKKINTSTRKFINDNVKINTSVFSYPIRKVAPTFSVATDNKPDLKLGLSSAVSKHRSHLRYLINL
jgi:hypothetical protein